MLFSCRGYVPLLFSDDPCIHAGGDRSPKAVVQMVDKRTQGVLRPTGR